MGNRRLLSGYDDVRLWDDQHRGRGSDPSPGGPAHPPHSVDECQNNLDMKGCPAYMPPATTTGFQIKGTLSLMTGNGTIAPFETNPPSSTLRVCVTGPSAPKYTIENSNITLLFAGPATKHFGPQALHGVVRRLPAD